MSVVTLLHCVYTLLFLSAVIMGIAIVTMAARNFAVALAAVAENMIVVGALCALVRFTDPRQYGQAVIVHGLCALAFGMVCGGIISLVQRDERLAPAAEETDEVAPARKPRIAISVAVLLTARAARRSRSGTAAQVALRACTRRAGSHRHKV